MDLGRTVRLWLKERAGDGSLANMEDTGEEEFGADEDFFLHL